VTAAVNRAFRRPSSPVQALAFPELTTIALTRPFFMFSRLIITGAALTLFVVKTPDATAALSEKIKARSGIPPFLIPATTADPLNPSILKSFSAIIQSPSTNSFLAPYPVDLIP
jgi:hypothetical protein